MAGLGWRPECQEPASLWQASPRIPCRGARTGATLLTMIWGCQVHAGFGLWIRGVFLVLRFENVPVASPVGECPDRPGAGASAQLPPTRDKSLAFSSKALVNNHKNKRMIRSEDNISLQKKNNIP